MENQKLQSRRDFMRTAGKIALGATALGVASPLLSAYDSAKAETTMRPCAAPWAAAPAPSACCASPRTQRPFWRICAPGTVSMSSPHTIPTTMRPPRPLPTP